MTYSPAASLVERIERDLREEFGSHAQVRDASALRSLIQRGAERAKGYGLEDDEHVFQFVRCMVMLDDEIDGRNPDTEDVWLTLNHAKRPAAQRIERAVKIASRLAAERSGSRSRGGSAPAKPVAARPMPAAAPAAAPPADAAPSHGYSRAGRSASLTDADVTADPDHSSATHATRGTPPPPPDAADAEESLPEIAGFAIKEEIGAGGMGRVFLAYDTQLDKDVAIKVLRSVDPESQEQLQHEARAAAKLEHPNIVHVARFEKLGRGGFYIMQFVRGLDGSKLVKRFESKAAHQLGGEAILSAAGVDPRRSPAELRELISPDKNAYYRMVAYWIAGVADGLERAHSEGVLHRDIKPSNLLLSSDGRMMITDFGLAARPADRQGIGRARVGTPRYLSPERVADWASFSDEVQQTDARADVWSLGAVLYEFLAYRPAFRGTVAEVLRDIVTQSPEKPTTLVWSTPELLERICLMAMARRPEDRFMRAGDMAEALRGWLRVESGVEKKGRIPFLT
jgi:serine/threonine protein kinase